jgi:hypothetical protein
MDLGYPIYPNLKMNLNNSKPFFWENVVVYHVFRNFLMTIDDNCTFGGAHHFPNPVGKLRTPLRRRQCHNLPPTPEIWGHGWHELLILQEAKATSQEIPEPNGSKWRFK